MGNLLRRRMMMQTAGGSPAVDDKTLFDQYVRPSFWIDGIQNTYDGHNPNATRWVNHMSSDPKKEFIYPSNAVIGDKYCIPNGETLYVAEGTTYAQNMTQLTDSYSIEIVVEPIESDVPQMIAPNQGNNYGTFWIDAAVTAVYFSAGSNGGAVGVAASPGVHTYVATGKGKTYYMDGEPVSTVTASSTWGRADRTHLFYYNGAYGRPCKSKIFAIRWYNRQLTAEEVAHNYELDKIRFGSGV